MRRECYSDFDGLDSSSIDSYLAEGAKKMSRSKRNKKNKGYSSVNTKAKISTLPEVPKCRHYYKRLELPSGIIVQASSLTYSHRPDENVPDFGLYSDYSWKPSWRAEFINFPDYQAPVNFHAAAEAIIEAYGRALDGQGVETGCIGGHGRTGTVLACWSVLGGLTALDACSYVWENYCPEAIESKAQVRFIEWFAHNTEGV